MTSSTHSKKFLSVQSLLDLQNFCTVHKVPAFRAKQVHHWIYTKLTSNPDEMKNLPANLRELLSQNFVCNSTQIIERCPSNSGTTKVLMQLHDGNTIEAVMIPAPERMTFCISSQVGCPVQCRFCASGAHGLQRNLHAGEIVDQFMTLSREYGSLPTNLVFMGIGEPLLNFEAVSRAISVLTESDYIGFSPRRITVSTSGITQGIYQLAELDKPLYLALSLHATDDETRAKIIPDHFRHPIAEILKACEAFTQKHNRLVTLEYTLMDGVNCNDYAAKALAKIAFKLRAKVNLIPYNQVEGAPFRRPSPEAIARFESIVDHYGANVTQRISKGEDLAAACGQLRSRRLKERSDS